MLLVDIHRGWRSQTCIYISPNNIAATKKGHETINSVNFLHYDEQGQGSCLRQGYEPLQGPVPDGDPRDVSSTLRALPHLRPDQ